MSKHNWLNEKLCSIADDKVRVEQGPQIVEMDCSEHNLGNDVTHANYRRGGIDAHGKTIGDSGTMHCVDWHAKIAPHLWKVYQWQDIDGVPQFVKVAEFEDKDAALESAETFIKGAA